ncbi:MAG: hypothetical protein ACK4NR_08245 [Micavibrio sp.]
MLRLLPILFVLMLGPQSARAAELTDMVCEQDEVVILRFGSDRAQKQNERATIRFNANKMYAKDANGQEHEYPVSFISGPRYEAENWTMIFNPDMTSADVALVTMTDVQTTKWRCKKGQ